MARQTSRGPPFYLIALFAIQALCAAFFISDIVITVFALSATPLDWRVREALEIAASVGLVLGLVFGTTAILRARRSAQEANAKLDRLSMDFQTLVDRHFDEWKLSPSEREVAWLIIKGFGPAEIAGIAGKKTGTIKSQSAAVYRKAGVSNRAQLIAGVVDELLVRT